MAGRRAGLQTTTTVVALMLLSVALALALSQPTRLMTSKTAKKALRVAARLEVVAFDPGGQLSVRNLGPDTIPAGRWHVLVDGELRGELQLQELQPGEQAQLSFQPVDPAAPHFIEVSGPAGVHAEAGWTP